MSSPRALGLVLAVLFIAACGAAGSSSPTAGGSTPAVATPRESPLTPSLAPVTTPAPSPSPAPTSVPSAGAIPVITTLPSPVPTPSPAAALALAKIGELRLGPGEFGGLLRVGTRWVAWGSVYPEGVDPDTGEPVLATWSSTDLRSWRRTIHGELVVPCPGWTARPNLDAVTVRSDGTTAVILAALHVPDSSIQDGCDRTEILSISSRDGITWTRSSTFRPTEPGTSQWVYPQGPWRISNGWETHIHAGEDENGDVMTVWQTDDLLAWRQIGTFSGFETGGWGVSAVGEDGTRLMVDQASDPDTLLASTDGISWRRVRTLPSWAPFILPPSPTDDRWVVAVVPGEGVEGDAKLLLTRDLASWSTLAFPRGGVGSLVRTTQGWLAVGYTPAEPCMENCPAPDPRLYASADEGRWARQSLRLPGGRSMLSLPVLIEDGARAVLVSRAEPPGSPVVIYEVRR